jgi:hypothetical protein
VIQRLKGEAIPAKVHENDSSFLRYGSLHLVFQGPFVMRCSLLFVLVSLAVVSKAADPVLETRSFNVTRALLDHGVDVSDLPVSAKDAMRSDTGCAAAVSSTILDTLCLV